MPCCKVTLIHNFNFMKQWFRSKRLWVGILSLLTSVSLLLTGEKSWAELSSEVVLGAFGVIQTIIALVSGDPIAFGSRTLYRGKK